MTSNGAPRVLLVHEWLVSRAGSEKVFEEFLTLFPGADVATLWMSDEWRARLSGRAAITLLPGSSPREVIKAGVVPLMPGMWQRLDGRKYDLILSSQHAFAHSAGAIRKAAKNLTYVHAPARCVWDPAVDMRGGSRFLRPVQVGLRRLDRRLAGHHTSIAANSRAVQQRIRDYWGRDSVVLHPPVEVDTLQKFVAPSASRDYIVGAGRWVSYKRPEEVIRVGEVLGLPVKLLGAGPMRDQLAAYARVARTSVELIEAPTDETFRRVLGGAKCLVHPGVEDFGITMVEAIAGGTPVLAPAEGGALDIVQEGVNGALVSDVASAEAWQEAFAKVQNLPPEVCCASADTFSSSSFRSAVRNWVAGVAPELGEALA